MPGCSFKAARKDNLRQHQDRIHGPPSALKPSESTGEATIVPFGGSTNIMMASTISTEEVALSKKTDHRALLFQAATEGNVAVLQASLDEGVDINASADDGASALHCAARAGQTEVVMHLVQRGADTQHANEKKRIPLHEAILGRNAQTVKALLHVSPSFEIDDKAALCIARSDSVEVLNHCVEHLGAAMSGANKYSMLLAAAKHGQKSMMATLLRLTEEFDENSSSGDDRLLAGKNLPWARQPDQDYGFSPLHIAVTRGDLEMTQLLVEHGFKVNGRAGFVKTPLHLAASKGHIGIWRYLLSCDDIQVNRKPCNSPVDDLLNTVVACGHMEMIKSLLSHDHIEVNCRGSKTWHSQRRTPLHMAAISGRLSVLQLLLMDVRVDRKARDRWELSALALSALYGHWELVRILLDQDKIETSPKRGAKTQEKDSPIPSKLVERLLTHPDFQNVNILGSPLDDRFEPIGGLLHVAVKQGDCDMLKVLLNHEDVDVNLRSQWTRTTPLHLAANLGRMDMARLLLRHKHIKMDLESYNFLNNRPGRRNVYGSALQIATKKGHTDLVELLLAHGTMQDESHASSPSKNGANELLPTATVQQGDSVIDPQLEMEEHSFLDEYMQDSSECILDANDIPVTEGQSWLDTVLSGDGIAQELI
ncbi:ankyrin repeat-containing domain protein [Paraphoma chrysanthemicola]|uniref:Ankyrin repeat-containing domain protein n=1 Tax=Paraphoma chrysanthemicola TaxID=798071 RepID=A0A8K0R5M4_9PLEO|nr:ankyrin repeat-containing domain protein [Paraphoma chrysanthemicola]